MQIEVSFPGGKRVDARIGHHVVRTDQPAAQGGDDSAVPPFDLFLASLGTCAGIYVLGFCQARQIPTDGLRVVQHVDFDPTSKLPTRVRIDLTLPPDFPDEYRAAVVRAAESCKVKKAMFAPPAIDVAITNAARDLTHETAS